MEEAPMEQGVKWATELIDQKLQEQERLESQAPEMPPAVARMDTPELEDEKRHGPVHWGIEGLKGQGRERKSSLDLRREIIHVGGIQYLFELRKTRRKRREEKVAPEPEPEPEEIVGPVEEEAFLRAAVQGKIRVIEKFLGDGGSPDTCDELDCTAVHWACRGGQLDAVKLLQDRGADLNLKDKLMSTPLHVATRTGQTEIVEHLINTGVDVNSRDREGDSALHDAVRLNRYKIIKMLILCGADMMAQNLAGKTPTDLVQLWQADTRQALEMQEPGETEAPA
nr:ankyrin repeat domain-containing protein 2 isoform X2 [Chrysemys picta bellii]